MQGWLRRGGGVARGGQGALGRGGKALVLSGWPTWVTSTKFYTNIVEARNYGFFLFFFVKIGFNFMNVKMTRMDSKVSIHFCIYEDRADTNL
jgi:hypothetical protein